MSGNKSSRVSIPSSVQKTIENIKEIAGTNLSEDDIYAMLKDCSMDPNETAQKLLFQDTFHEVKRKRDRKREESAEPKWKPAMQGRGNFTSRHASLEQQRSAMVNTWTTASHSEPTLQTSDPVSQQLATIAAKLEAIDALAADVATLKAHHSQNQQSDHNKDPNDKGKAKLSPEEVEVDSTWWHRDTSRRSHTEMEFPKYEGGDPRGWILKAEKYFQYYQTPDDRKVDVASMYLEGDALDLFAWINSERTIYYWDELVKVLQENYGPAEFQNPDEHLCNIQQTGTVLEYRQEFVKRAARVQNWPEHCLLGVFLSGLKEELRVDVRIHKPRSVYKAMSLALEYEGKQGTNQFIKGPSWSSASRPSSVGTSVPSTREFFNPQSYHQPATRPVEQSSCPNSRSLNSDQQIRGDKGLCYRCGEKFSPGHRCKPGTFAFLELMHEENAEHNIEDENKNDDVPQAILGKGTATTLKLRGTLCGREVLMLVDSGSTHNFIAEEIVRELWLAVQYIPTFGVQIGNRDIIKCNKVCNNLSVELPELVITQDFFPFSIGGADIVLGIQWLASLNTVQANWNEMFLIFQLNGKKYRYKPIGTRCF